MLTFTRIVYAQCRCLVYWWGATAYIYTKESHAVLFMLIEVTFNVGLFDEISPVIFTAVGLSFGIHLTFTYVDFF